MTKVIRNVTNMKTTTTTTTTPFPQVERLLALLSARQTIEPASVNPSLFPGCLCNCVTQLKLYTLYKLSSPIFCCLSVGECVRDW